MSVRDTDRGAKKLMRALKKGPTKIDIGVVGEKADAKHGEGGMTVAQIMELHEYGLGVPQRSWLRGWLEEQKKEIEDTRSKLWRQVVKLEIQPKTAAQRFGAWAVGQIKKRIATSIPPPNAESTVRKKGSSVTLIDTGQGRAAINYRVVGAEGSSVEKE